MWITWIRAEDGTAAKIRQELESTSEIPKLERTIGADGKERHGGET